MLVPGLLLESARRHPERTALIHGQKRFTYRAVRDRSQRLARALGDAKVAPGDRVALYLENSFEYVTGYYGTLLAGAVAVPILTGTPPDVLHKLFSLAEIRTVISAEREARRLRGLEGIETLVTTGGDTGVGPGGVIFHDQLDERTPEATPPARSPEDLASIIFTSGSTGDPKGVMLSHRNLVANTRSIVTYLNLTGEERAVVVLPFPYVYGKSLLNTHICVGGSLVLENQLLFPNRVLDVLEREGATSFAGVPSTYAILLDRSSLSRRSLPSLRYVTQAGGAMAPATTLRLVEALPGVKVFVMYGATEASARLSFLDPERVLDKLGSVGKAIPGVRVAVEREDGSRASPGEVGEIVAYGDNVMRGYWKDPEGSAHALRGGGYHTGDLGYVDDEGFLYITGRIDHMMKIGGHRVSPIEIERALLEHPDVSEAAVVGVPDGVLGEVPHAFVVPRPGARLSDDGLLEHCRSTLQAHKVPKKVEVVAALPHNESGKVSRSMLARGLS